MSNGKLIHLLKRILFCIANVLFVFFLIFSALVCMSILWMFDTWPNLSMEELVYQLQASFEGTSRGMVGDYLLFSMPVVVIVFVVAMVTVTILRKKKKIYRGIIAISILVSVVALVGECYLVWNRLDVRDYVEGNNTYSTFIDTNYVDPSEIELVFPTEKRNLIYIFLESMEVTYVDEENGGAFDDNYIPELAELAVLNEDFSGNSQSLNGGSSLYSTTWTAAAMFAQTAGLPLSLPIDGNSMDTQESFLPGITTLGDVLEEQGYNQTLMIGSAGNFGGRSLYFSEHGDYSIKDYYYYQELGKYPEDYWVWWGFEDNKLFEYAKEELIELSSQSEPFNLTLLTADTHFEDGYTCELCGSEYGDNIYANVLSCSSRQVSEFVEWIQQQEFYENTTIVISGDHLTMDSDFCEQVDDSYERKVYTTYINSAVQPENPEGRREYSTFDNFPTTLASIGVEIVGNRLGLGTNLFSDEKTLVELYGVDQINSELKKRSELMDEFTSTIDEDSPSLKIRERRAPVANVVTESYGPVNEEIRIIVSDFENIDNGIMMITAAVWTAEDQSDLQWVQAIEQEDGTYIAEVFVSGLASVGDEYYVEVYLTDVSGVQYYISSATGYIQ